MHLNSLRLSRFSAFGSLTMPFQTDLTVQIREDNGGNSKAFYAIGREVYLILNFEVI